MFFVLEDTTFTRDSKKEDEFEEHILQQVQSIRSKDNVDVILSSSASVKTEENESVDESTILNMVTVDHGCLYLCGQHFWHTFLPSYGQVVLMGPK